MVYMAGLDAVIKFVGIYAQNDIGLGGKEFALLFVLLQLSAVAGAFGFGFLESRLGPKRTVLATLGWWIIGIAAIYNLDLLASMTGSQPKQVFFGVGLMAGAGIGATQSASRTVVGLLAPRDRTAQMFGFWSMFSRLSTILAMAFGFVADFFGSRRAALLLVLAFFIVGALLLARVDVDRGVEEVAADSV
jgi:MFS transporter, UMF1 family